MVRPQTYRKLGDQAHELIGTENGRVITPGGWAWLVGWVPCDIFIKVIGRLTHDIQSGIVTCDFYKDEEWPTPYVTLTFPINSLISGDADFDIACMGTIVDIWVQNNDGVNRNISWMFAGHKR